MNRILNIVFICLFSLSGCFSSYAADTVVTPRAILVQLRSEHNRIEALARDRRHKELEEVKNDAVAVRQKMILDFSDNFTKCPVYYYMDTDINLIKNKQFDGALLNADGSPAHSIPLNNGSRDYLVVFYGQPVSQPKNTAVVTDTTKYSYESDVPFGKGLVILNVEFKQVNYLYMFGYNQRALKRSIKTKKYCYSSKHFDIEYFPFAKLFNNKLTTRFATHNSATKKNL